MKYANFIISIKLVVIGIFQFITFVYTKNEDTSLNVKGTLVFLIEVFGVLKFSENTNTSITWLLDFLKIITTKENCYECSIFVCHLFRSFFNMADYYRYNQPSLFFFQIKLSDYSKILLSKCEINFDVFIFNKSLRLFCGVIICNIC